MLNFAEQTGSGAVMLVWSFPHLGSVDFSNITSLRACSIKHRYYTSLHNIEIIINKDIH
jgi:hypothetical protein